MKVVVRTAAKVRDRGVGGLLMSSLDDLARWATEDRAEIARVAAPNGTVTILFSDIEGSTALNEELGDARWNRLLKTHDLLLRQHVDKFSGHVVKSQGDGFMVAFSDPTAAVRAAVDAQRAVASARQRNLRRTPIRIRIGVHTGSVVSRDGDYFGRNAAMAARIAAHADGGDTLVSDDVHDALRDNVESAFAPVQEVELKGFSGAHTLWALSTSE